MLATACQMESCKTDFSLHPELQVQHYCISIIFSFLKKQLIKSKIAPVSFVFPFPPLLFFSLPIPLQSSPFPKIHS